MTKLKSEDVRLMDVMLDWFDGQESILWCDVTDEIAHAIAYASDLFSGPNTRDETARTVIAVVTLCLQEALENIRPLDRAEDANENGPAH